MRTRLALLSAPKSKPDPEPEPKLTESWSLPAPEQREAILGGVAAVAAWLAAVRRRKA